MDIDNEDLLYGVPRIAAAFKLTPQQVYHLKREHGLPTFKIGRIVCASRDAVRDWIAKRAEVAARAGRLGCE